MKKIIFSLLFALLAEISSASDLTFTVVNETPASSNGSIDLNVSGGIGPFTYSWSGPSGFTATTEDVSGLVSGNYTVVVTDQYCGVATITVFVDVVSASGISENGENHFTIFPNPSQSQITISTDSFLENASLKLTDITGRLITEQTGAGGNTVSFDVSGQPAGTYFVEIVSKGVLSRLRFVKK